MTRLKRQVSRADILRLLAVSRTASADAAAKLAGYIPEQGSNQAQGKKITRAHIASHARSHQAQLSSLNLAEKKEISRNLPLEAFWYLSERKGLKKTLHHLADPQGSATPEERRSILAGALHKVRPLSAEELSVTEFTPSPACQHTVANPPQTQVRKQAPFEPDIESLVTSTSEFVALHCRRNKQTRETPCKTRAEKKRALRFQRRLRRLLGFLSVATYIEPSLLQEVVRLIPSSLPDIATETALQWHPDIERDSKNHLGLRPEKKRVYHQIFAQEASPLQAEMLGLLRQRDATSSPFLFALELLPVLPLLHSTTLQKQITVWLEAFILRFVRTWFERQEDRSLIKQAGQLLDLMERLPKERKRPFTARSFLYGIVHRDALRTGEALPAEYNPEAVIQTVQKLMSPVRYQVLQQGERLFLYPSDEIALLQLPGSPLLELELSVDCLLLYKRGVVVTLPVRSGELVYDCTGQEEAFFVQTPTEQLVFDSCFRPSWAQAMGRHTKGFFVDAPWLGKTCRLTWKNSTGEGPGRWIGNGDLQTDQHGLFVDLKIKKQVIQRFRRIIPDWFMMGSPEDEPERESWGKESLHEVILTKGFWVADTAVTQRLWQTVVGDNPSRFQGVDHPVEQVSYHDALFFLQRLNALIPGVRARLLTEAEWEYCCRAGTATPFSFGTCITPDQVNYNGQYPYHTGPMGRNRQQSVAVRSFPCNAWGLFEMHGNVWEWCQDYWQEDLFSEEPQRDPQGPENGEFQVVRGGSWFLAGRGVRSAVRGKFAPHFRNSRIGFRIALTPEEEKNKGQKPSLHAPKAAPRPRRLQEMLSGFRAKS